MKSQPPPPAGSTNTVNAHCVYADVERAELFCAACSTYVYALEFDKTVNGVAAVATGVGATTGGAEKRAAGDGDGDAIAGEEGGSNKKRKKTTPRTQLAKMDVHAAGGAPLASVNAHGVPRGLRGFANLGNTCFLSTVMQAVVRAPNVGGFFLRDGHNRHACGRERAERWTAAASAEDEHCLACELDGLVGEAYSGSGEPIVPSAFLHSWWRQSSEHLAKHRQHDAHEFFLSLVATVHTNLCPHERRRRGVGVALKPATPPESSPAPPGWIVSQITGESAASEGAAAKAETGAGAGAGGSGEISAAPPKSPDENGGANPQAPPARSEYCECVLHRAFAGSLRSDVTCKRCGHTSTVNDPTVGLSLDVPVPLGADGRRGGKGRGGGSGGGPGITLEGCLRQFARPETLSIDGDVFPCARCGDTATPKMKQMAIRRLPPTLALHLKRFEHGGAKKQNAHGDGGGSKIESHVSFPFVLPMRAYCASTAIRERYGNRLTPMSDGGGGADDPKNYDLFAVVVHSGQGSDSGHYIAYVQWQGAWFRCDDHQVTRADPITVATAQAYLLFYQARPTPPP